MQVATMFVEKLGARCILEELDNKNLIVSASLCNKKLYFMLIFIVVLQNCVIKYTFCNF